MPQQFIEVHGACQHNLKNLDLKIPLGQITVITGVSGSGKSSLAFDTLYAEGQRRYVESFSAYARQFLDRMTPPQVERVEGLPPAIAIEQTNTIRSSRSTVGTMTEINDYMKTLFARLATLHCPGCGRPVHRDDPESIAKELLKHHRDRRAVVCFPLSLTKKVHVDQVESGLKRLGLFRLFDSREAVELTQTLLKKRIPATLQVLIDRLVLRRADRQRLIDSLEQALRFGKGALTVFIERQDRGFEEERYSEGLHCAQCNVHFAAPTPNLFSFNSPIGACPTCNGFGRTIAIDHDLVIPDPRKTLAGGAIRPWTGGFSVECQEDLLRHCKRKGIPTNVPFEKLSAGHRSVVLDGDGDFYGVQGYFDWLEGRVYKMHVRVLLSRYRAYVTCKKCGGARLKDEALYYRLNGKTLYDIYAMAARDSETFFNALQLPKHLDKVSEILLGEIRSRLRYLNHVGLDYLTLDRQSRTLSGGEVQRVNLTSAIGSSLVNTLFVLDEPTIGLHPRDTGRVVDVLERLRQNRNTILVVEHDPDVIRRGDHLIDLGPGAGAGGGQVIYQGKVSGLSRAKESLTAAYVTGKKSHPLPEQRRGPQKGRRLTIQGARENNLKNLTVKIPLGLFVCITGVSGSGKSTLIEQILYPALKRELGQGVGASGKHKAIRGAKKIEAVHLVDQSPIGRTPRANPATYLKLFDSIRKQFAALPASRARGYTPGTFSFNSPHGGRCPKCSGEGFERVEMQFLSDVFVTCEVCGGKRYQQEILEIELDGKNIHQVLDMTLNEARTFFAGRKEMAATLELLEQIGLGYLRLGQPINTLSGGEAQRLKLASFLSSPKKANSLFLFDEPTTGLHPDDIRKLLAAIDRLVEGGASVVVIEHNLDVIKSADYLIDLGPEGGDAGGEIVAEGSPEAVMQCDRSHTGKCLKRYLKTSRVQKDRRVAKKVKAKKPAKPVIAVRGAREHNLRNINLDIPHQRMTVITGPSGSGKSTLAFDILFAEGQRRFIDCLSAYARQYIKQAHKPEVDRLSGIPPTVSIEQRLSRGGRKSTVGTVTEIYHYLRLLFCKLGEQHCEHCGRPVGAQDPADIVREIRRLYPRNALKLLAPLVRKRKGIYRDLFKRLVREGITEARIDGRWKRLDPPPELSRFVEHDVEIPIAELSAKERTSPQLRRAVERGLKRGRGLLLALPAKGKETLFSTERYCVSCRISYPEPDPRWFSYNSRHGWCPSCEGYGFLWEEDPEEATPATPCPDCDGSRLNALARGFKIQDRHIGEVAHMTPGKVEKFLRRIRWKKSQRPVAGPILKEIASRLRFLEEVGLNYLTLDRDATTLSGGEAQRIRLAAQLGSNLSGICYILDEPTIGLHPRDHQRLLETLERLKARGNSVVIVEHDEATMRRADYLIDLGPGGGVHGGRVVAEGTLSQIQRNRRSPTGRYLKSAKPSRNGHKRRDVKGSDCRWLEVLGAEEHNLKRLDVRVPLGRWTVVTGVSGSGKSTLVRDILYNGLRRQLHKTPVPVGKFKGFRGTGPLRRVAEVDQTPIGKTPRSVPATYVGFFGEIRNLFAAQPEARMRGYGPGRFSFNVATGRCPKCSGQGRIKMEMSFLPDVFVDCDACGGRRYTEETLQVEWNGKSIADVIEMTVEEAAKFFSSFEKIHRPLSILNAIGLGYLTLGQASNTLSGGEAQRIKLAAELSKPTQGGTLFVLDEPTTGLHFVDIEKLVAVLHSLVDQGNTLVVVEHNLDFIKEADYIIDLGPEGGDAGGRIVATGPPEKIVQRTKQSYTARFLREYL